MKIEISSLRQSATTKVAVIGFLILVMLIPISMIDGVVDDRSRIMEVARTDISNAWGGLQVVAGPMIAIPWTVEKKTADGQRLFEDKTVYLLAESLLANVDLASQVRKRGIHGIPVYAAMIKISGSFNFDNIARKYRDSPGLKWNRARLVLGVTDASAITQRPMLTSGKFSGELERSRTQIPGLPPQLSVDIGELIGTPEKRGRFEFAIELGVNGTDTFQVLPLANSAEITASSDWPSPSFIGRRLPVSHDVRADGFEARWQANSLGRELPTTWSSRDYSGGQKIAGAFGVRLIQPLGLYRLMYRALNYAILFVGLTFVTFFMMEIVAATRLHPLQYLLVGLANTLFYLLLLSLAEHVGFGKAYLASALASSALIVGYCRSVLATRGQVFAMGAVLVVLYAFLYMTLRAESFALLAGSLGLWLILAAVMYLTRSVDWYALGRKKPAAD